jgi:sulfur carrier protein ThiS
VQSRKSKIRDAQCVEITVYIYPQKTRKKLTVEKEICVENMLEMLGIPPGNAICIIDGKIMPVDAVLTVNGTEKIEVHRAFSGG